MKRLINCLFLLFVLSFFISCQKEVSVEQSAPSRGSLQNSLGDCLPKTVAGTYVANRTLIDSNFIEVTINVATAGSYMIATDTVNGYSFKAAGVFNATGATKVKLAGSGRPVIGGVNDFTVVFDTTFCFLSVTVLPAGSTGGPATFNLQTPGAGCAVNFSPSGTYVKDVALNGGNTISAQINVTALGTWSVSTAPVNGYSFSGSGTFSTLGAQTIILQGSGKPLAAQTDNFPVTAGSSTCSFPITVTATVPPPVINTDYFPLTQNSYWTYDTNGTDTFKITNNGPVTFSGTTFQRFIYSDAGGNFDSAYFRKDAVTGFYYQSLDTAGTGPDLTFTQPRVEIQFLRNVLTLNQTWNSDINAVYRDPTSGTTAPIVIRFKYTCLNPNATVTVNGKTFTNAYKVQEEFQIGQSGVFAPQGSPIIYYYVKGVGRVQTNDGTASDNIRFWQVF
jgi:hypothetical protein